VDRKAAMKRTSDLGFMGTWQFWMEHGLLVLGSHVDWVDSIV